MALLATTIAAISADYVVEPGDTLAAVAAEHGVSVQDLVAANDIDDPDVIRPGQVLVIPGPDETSRDTDTSGTHVVAAGESLAGIARRYGTTVRAIVDANAIADPDLVLPGQVLQVPGPGSTATIHVVEPGDTLAGIARTHGTTAEAIARANGITDDVIYVGTTLRIGGPATPIIEPTSETGVHRVEAGETLAAIARRYGTNAGALATDNGLDDPDLIVVGQELTVPMSGWRCPVPGSTSFNDWGFPRSGSRFHQGNDLFAPAGTPVFAPVSGTVRYVEGTLGGLQFWLTAADGTTYIGSHLDSLGVGPGPVEAGSQLGTVGTTGNAVGSRPHLHFEIHVDDRPVNPWPTLQAAGC